MIPQILLQRCDELFGQERANLATVLGLVFSEIEHPELLMRVDAQGLLHPVRLGHRGKRSDLALEQIGALVFVPHSAFAKVARAPGKDQQPSEDQFVPSQGCNLLGPGGREGLRRERGFWPGFASRSSYSIHFAAFRCRT